MISVSYHFSGGSGKADLEIDNDKILLLASGSQTQILNVPLTSITLLDVTALRYGKDSVLTLECQPVKHKLLLLRLSIPSLTEIEKIVKQVQQARPQVVTHGSVPSILFSSALLPHYRPRLRQALGWLGLFSGAVLYLGLFFYWTDLINKVPEIDLMQLYPYCQQLLAFCIENPLYGALIGCVMLMSMPLIWTIAMLMLTTILPMILARQFIGVLASMTFLKDIRDALKTFKAIQKSTKNLFAFTKFANQTRPHQD